MPQFKRLRALLAPAEPDKKPLTSPTNSILKAAPIVDPHMLDPTAKRDYSALKAVLLLLGLPVSNLDEFISRVWEQFLEIGQLNASVHSRFFD